MLLKFLNNSLNERPSREKWIFKVVANQQYLSLMPPIVHFIPDYRDHGFGLAYSETSKVILCWTGGDCEQIKLSWLMCQSISY